MKVKFKGAEQTKRHTFTVAHKKNDYRVVIWLDETGKFMDEEVSFNGEELEGEGTEGEVREAIIDYLADNWETLVK
jgi:hypothetical protein